MNCCSYSQHTVLTNFWLTNHMSHITDSTSTTFRMRSVMACFILTKMTLWTCLNNLRCLTDMKLRMVWFGTLWRECAFCCTDCVILVICLTLPHILAGLCPTIHWFSITCWQMSCTGLYIFWMMYRNLGWIMTCTQRKWPTKVLL